MTETPPTKQELINSMTNWQRNQFMKAVKGNVKDAPLETAIEYASKPHWKQTL